MQQPAAAAAVRMADALEPWVLEQQVALCEVPAPPFAEKARAEVYRQAFLRHGLRNVRIDAVGNVIGERPGTGRRAASRVQRAPGHRVPGRHRR